MISYLQKISKMTGLLMCLWISHAAAQSTQVLISPTGDGGFENGADFAANGWTVENYTSNNTNKWIVGEDTKSAGARSAYISDNTISYQYTDFGSANRSRVMFWRDIMFPAGYTTITLSFKIKVQGQSNRDDLTVFFQNSNTVPSTAQLDQSFSSAPFIPNTRRVATISMQGTHYVTKTYTLNADNTNVSTTRRLIFYWEDDGWMGTQPPASIDEISVTAFSSCTPPALTAYANNDKCGPGTVTLNATATSGATVNWYTSPYGGALVATGNTYTTPVLASSTNYYISARQGNCETSSPRQMVRANIRPIPVVNLGNDIERCAEPNDSVFLDAGMLPNNPTFQWNDGYTGASRYVHQSGTYMVTATDQYNCEGADTITVNMKPFPVVDLGNDTNVCLGSSAILDARNPGAAYLWNTGNTTRQINVRSAGNFSVKVTNPEGCSRTDTITVTMNGQLPAVDDIIIRNDGFRTFTFIVDNPRQVIAYDWDFGDGTSSSEPSPTHTYADPGAYIVTLTLQSTCGTASYSRAANIVGIKQLDIAKESLLITPNPSRGDVVIVNKSTFKMAQIEIYDINGRQLYYQKADNALRHNIVTENLSGGGYLIKIITDEGVIIRRLQLLK